VSQEERAPSRQAIGRRASQGGHRTGELIRQSDSGTTLPAFDGNHRVGAQGTSTQNHLSEREIDFAELDDGSFVETIEDPADTMRTALAVFRNGRTRITSQLEYHDQMLVPIPRSAVGFSDVKLPSGVMPYKSVTRLFHLVFSFMKFGIDVSGEYFPLISAFVLYTWVADSLLLPIAVYLSLIGPRTGL
jgi:hypothetical protein